MNRPVLLLQTVYFHESDREEARRLGSDLYERLTRPMDDPLAHGPNIPVLVGVRADLVRLDAADTTIVIPVLGQATFGLMADSVLKKLQEWHGMLGVGRLLPIPSSQLWRDAEDRLPGKQLLSMLYGKGDLRRATLDEIVLAVSRLFSDQKDNVQLFVSHAKADLASTDEAARKIHLFVISDTTGKAFFDANTLRPGESLEGQLDGAVAQGVMISVRGDAYSSRVWCQREVLMAKLNGVPTVSVEVLRKGELRSSPYCGNGPSLVWDGNPTRIVSLAMVEWLRSQYFRREAERIKEAAELPADVKVVARPPELLDLAQGPLHSDRAQLVLHPDPELSVLERRVLKAARPRLHLATPSTAFRRLLSRGGDETAGAASPLEGMQVAMSLSESPDADGPEGFTEHHVYDATVSIARSLISAGAAIAYGGDFRTGGYTPLLGQLIQNYNQTASKRAQNLHSYLAANLDLGEAPPNVPLSFHHLKESPDFAAEARLPVPTKPAGPTQPPAAFYFSDMRRVMEKHTQARVILGGNADARVEQGGKGYGGRYPGVVEEAWRTLEASHPLYVAGGFGGAAGMVADLLEGKETPPKLQDGTWMASEFYAENARKLDEHPARTDLGLPKTIADLAGAIVALAAPLLKTDESSLAWNGLSVADNRRLFRTRDPVELAALVSRGLLRVAQQEAEGFLQIELIQDSLTAADHLDAVAIATLEGVPLGGAGAAIDRLTGGTASQARAQGESLVSLQESLIDADWLFLASLGALGDRAALPGRIEEAAADTAAQAARHGFQRVGVVTFGGNVLPETEKVAEAMVRGFERGAGRPSLAWYETDAARFQELADILGQNARVKLTTRRALTPISFEAPPPEPLVLTVRLEGGSLSATSLPPSSAAAVSTFQSALSDAELAQLARGTGDGRNTPSLEALSEQGTKLADRLFGKDAPEMLSLCRKSRMIVVHDAAAARVPFEMMLAGGVRPALEGGITRRLSIPELALERQFSRPAKKGKLKVLLIVNPTGDLPGTVTEANAVKELLLSKPDGLDLVELWQEKATVKNVVAALQEADLLHYCGHAFFDGPEARRSGLILAGGVEFTGEDLARVGTLPRMAFVNACEAGRVRGAAAVQAAAFAELFLRSGMDAYLGTFWRVGDAAAAIFASTVYTRLALGDTLEQATLAGRQALYAAKEADWANYLLFGGGSFRLIAP